MPEHKIITLAARQDYEGFYQLELELRRVQHCPPFGDVVQLKVWVAWGKSNTYSQTFTYHPDGPVQSFRISGATLNNSVQYLGALEK